MSFHYTPPTITIILISTLTVPTIHILLCAPPHIPTTILRNIAAVKTTLTPNPATQTHGTLTEASLSTSHFAKKTGPAGIPPNKTRNPLPPIRFNKAPPKVIVYRNQNSKALVRLIVQHLKSHPALLMPEYTTTLIMLFWQAPRILPTTPLTTPTKKYTTPILLQLKPTNGPSFKGPNKTKANSPLKVLATVKTQKCRGITPSFIATPTPPTISHNLFPLPITPIKKKRLPKELGTKYVPAALPLLPFLATNPKNPKDIISIANHKKIPSRADTTIVIPPNKTILDPTLALVDHTIRIIELTSLGRKT